MLESLWHRSANKKFSPKPTKIDTHRDSYELTRKYNRAHNFIEDKDSNTFEDESSNVYDSTATNTRTLSEIDFTLRDIESETFRKGLEDGANFLADLAENATMQTIEAPSTCPISISPSSKTFSKSYDSYTGVPTSYAFDTAYHVAETGRVKSNFTGAFKSSNIKPSLSRCSVSSKSVDYDSMPSFSQPKTKKLDLLVSALEPELDLQISADFAGETRFEVPDPEPERFSPLTINTKQVLCDANTLTLNDNSDGEDDSDFMSSSSETASGSATVIKTTELIRPIEKFEKIQAEADNATVYSCSEMASLVSDVVEAPRQESPIPKPPPRAPLRKSTLQILPFRQIQQSTVKNLQSTTVVSNYFPVVIENVRIPTTNKRPSLISENLPGERRREKSESQIHLSKTVSEIGQSIKSSIRPLKFSLLKRSESHVISKPQHKQSQLHQIKRQVSRRVSADSCRQMGGLKDSSQNFRVQYFW